MAVEAKYPAAKLYEAYRHYCQAIGRKPQSTNAFKKALDKLANVYQSRTSSGMQWQGIQPVLQFKANISVVSVGSVGVLENFLLGDLWALF